MTSMLIADDEDDMLLLLRVMIRVANEGLEVTSEARDGQQAIDLAFGEAAHHDVIVLDNRMPRKTGLEAAAEILERRPNQPIILYSAHLDDDMRAQAESIGIRACLTKTDIEQIPDLARSLAV